MKKYRVGICTILFSLLFGLFQPFHLSAVAYEMPDALAFAEEIVTLVNEVRAEYGLDPVALAPIILEASSIRAQEQQVQYGHIRPDGSSWSTVLNEVGIDSNCYAAENVAAGYETPEEAMNGWIHSDTHRAAILGENYQYIGIGISYLPNDPNYYFYYWQMLLISADPPLEGAWIPGQEQTGTTTFAITTETDTSYTESTAKAVYATLPGDTDLNGKLTLADTVMIQLAIMKQVALNETQMVQADVYQDGCIDQMDALILIQYLTERAFSLPVIPIHSQ